MKTARKKEREKREKRRGGETINGGQPPSLTSRPPGLMVVCRFRCGTAVNSPAVTTWFSSSESL